MPLVLVTGGSGFIGRHLVDALLSRGEAVRVLDLAEPEGLAADVDFVRGSVADRAAVERAVRGAECVYHLAGIPHFWWRDKRHLDTANHKGAETVMRVAAEQRTPRVVHCSTESILLPKSRRSGARIDESAKPSLEEMPGPYTRSKFLGERAALAAARDGLNVVVVNPTVPVGDGDRNMTPPAAMFALLLRGGSPFFLDCVLNLVDVRDVADGILRAAYSGRKGERYILGGENLRLSEILAIVERKSGRPMPRREIPAPLALAAGAIAEWIADRVTHAPPVTTREAVELALRSAPFDCRKAADELGYAPRPVDGALTQVVEAFKRSQVGPKSL